MRSGGAAGLTAVRIAWGGDMEGYIGLHVGSAGCTLVSLAATRESVRQLHVETNGRALVQAVCRIPGRRHLVLEDGVYTSWLRETLGPYVDEIVVANVGPSAGEETGASAARWLAERRRAGDLQQVVAHDEGPLRRLRDLARAHDAARQDLSRVRQRLESLRPARASTGEWIRRPRYRESMTRRLPTGRGPRARCLHEQLDFLRSQKNRCEAELCREADRHPIVSILETAPGFTRVAAAQLLALVVTPFRFRSKRQFWSYCGLGEAEPCEPQRAPGDRGTPRREADERGRHGRERFNPELKRLFSGAAAAVARQREDDPLCERHRRRIADGMKPTLASLSLARSIAAIVLRMWKEERGYDPARLLVEGQSRGSVTRGVSRVRPKGRVPRTPGAAPFRR